MKAVLALALKDLRLLTRHRGDFFFVVAWPILLAVLCGCTSLNYKMQEKFLGNEKRDILVSRVGKANDAQKETQEVFKDALEQFNSVVQFDGGNLQKQYDKARAMGLLTAAQVQMVRLRIVPPAVAVRNRKEEAEADAMYFDRGALSRRELARRDHVDPAVMERERGNELRMEN